jgi:DNA-binding MarR family transcriptional regulator
MTERGRTEFETDVATVAESCLASQARRLSRTLTRHYNDSLRPLGINIAEMNLLVAIAASGPLRPTELARALDLEKSTLSRNLQRLAHRGWLVVRDNPNERGDLIQVTAAGERLLAQAIPLWKAAQQDALESIGGAAIPVLAERG